MARHWLICDLDGTLTDCSHRVHLAQAGLWDEFNAKCNEDKVRIETLAALHAFKSLESMILTGRPTRYRKMTLDWLSANSITPDLLLMRPDDDFRSDLEVKIWLLESYFGNQESACRAIMLVLEDREKVVEGLRNYGLTVWQVRQGDY